MNGTLFLYSLALHLAWMEGKANGINGVLAILFCLRNRIAANHEFGDLGRLIQVENFRRFLHIKNSNNLIEVPDLRDPIFQQAMVYVEGIFDNTTKDNLTDGALYWGDSPIGGKKIVAQIGQLKLWS